MKVGIQTIAWQVAEDLSLNILLPVMAREIREAGYEGIELFQRANDETHIRNLRDQLEKNSLELVGVSAGAFLDRVELVKSYRAFAPNNPTPYVYTDEWAPEQAQRAIDEGIPIGIHPHMFKPIQTVAEAIPTVDAQRAMGHDVGLLPDTAHVQIAGESPLDVLQKCFSKLTAIHIKDWNPEFGRSYQFYAGGFVPLGEGDVPLKAIIEYLRQKDYQGWLIVEVDVTENAFDIACKCRNWLRREGV